jgi:hypothetical protein
MIVAQQASKTIPVKDDLLANPTKGSTTVKLVLRRCTMRSTHGKNVPDFAKILEKVGKNFIVPHQVPMDKIHANLPCR